MGFGGGIIDALTQARTGQLTGQGLANDRATKDAMTQVLQQRAQASADQEAALKKALLAKTNAETTKLNLPPVAKAPTFHIETRPDGTYRINMATGEATKVQGVAGVPKTPTQPRATPRSEGDRNIASARSYVAGLLKPQAGLMGAMTPGMSPKDAWAKAKDAYGLTDEQVPPQFRAPKAVTPPPTGAPKTGFDLGAPPPKGPSQTDLANAANDAHAKVEASTLSPEAKQARHQAIDATLQQQLHAAP